MRPGARDIAALAGCLLIAVALAGSFILVPVPRPKTAPAAQFSAARAFEDVAVIAREPHQVGSAANRRVRDHLLARMTGLGFEPQLHSGEGLVVARQPERPRAYGATVDNIAGVLPGRDRAAPALALMAHYDSVAASPGAGDDAAGVAAALEVARALKVRGVPARDVILVFTDGEEAGLLGAAAFFANDPLAKRIGPIINLETRGGGGRAAMFETGKNNGGLVRALSGAVHRPLANSAAVFAYRMMPNSTDFTPAQAAGKTGYNFAFLGRQFDYHSPTSTPANLDKGSLQSMGDEVLPLAARLAFGPEVKPGPDLVFSQVFGSLVLAYPPVLGWGLLIACALLLAVAARGRPGWRDIAVGALSGLAVLLLSAGLLHLARLATGVGFSFVGQRPLLARAGLWEAAMLLLAASPLVLLARFSRHRLPGAWLGLLLLLLLAAAVVQTLAPLTAYMLAWPLLLASAMAAATRLGGEERPFALLILIIGAAFGLAWVGAYFHFLAQALDMPAVLAVFAFLAAALLWPLLRPVGFRTAAVLFAAGLLMVGWLRVSDPWSPRHPQATGGYYVAEVGKGFFRAVPPSLDGPWARSLLGPQAVTRPMQPLLPRARVAPAPPVAYEPLTYRFEPGPDGRLHLFVPWRPGLQVLALDLRVAGPVREVTLNGRPAGPMLPPKGAWSSVIFRPSESLDLAFRPTGPGKLEFRYAAVSETWPKDAAPLPRRGPKEMPWLETDSLAVVGQAALPFP